ncbi:putative topoisomerase VIA [Toxoplasma gondii TgCatPRC2]|uniref:DNA topoisomerase (ATP-hydrolyzing) n=1 Tax=Toxoplasma gondii TgCatPRC2 TaxID=1130821 RepID=A0A151HDS4_TOXGO|nr:putative topoisomerase VIA [Toxoplasma gondii TgCatPRC2]
MNVVYEAGFRIKAKQRQHSARIKHILEEHILRVVGWFANRDVDHLTRLTKAERTERLRTFGIKKLTWVLSLLDQIHGLLMTNRAATQRELFYGLVNVFDTQAQVNAQLQQIVSWLEIPRDSLNVFASQKGLVAGMLTFVKGSLTLDCRRTGTGVLISETLVEVDRLESHASYIIVVEKDAIFQTLCEQQIWNIIPCILITGKGFPDFVTRKLLRRLQMSLNIECGYVGDFDPHGISIFLSYQHGSRAFEGPLVRCAVLHWIGLCFEDLEQLPVDVRLPLLSRDRALLKSLLVHPKIRDCERLQAQCSFMMEHDTKFEIEAITCLGFEYLARYYIPSKILKRTWI